MERPPFLPQKPRIVYNPRDQNKSVIKERKIDQAYIEKLFILFKEGNISNIKNHIIKYNLSSTVLNDDETLLHIILKDTVLTERDKLELLLFLKQRGSLDTSYDKNFVTPLHLSSKYQLEPITNLLLANKHDPNALDANYKSPLHYAVIGNNVSCPKPKSKNQKKTIEPKNDNDNNIIKELILLFRDYLETDGTTKMYLEHIKSMINNADKLFSSEYNDIFIKKKEIFANLVETNKEEDLAKLLKNIKKELIYLLELKFENNIKKMEIHPNTITGWGPDEYQFNRILEKKSLNEFKNETEKKYYNSSNDFITGTRDILMEYQKYISDLNVGITSNPANPDKDFIGISMLSEQMNNILYYDHIIHLTLNTAAARAVPVAIPPDVRNYTITDVEKDNYIKNIFGNMDSLILYKYDIRIEFSNLINNDELKVFKKIKIPNGTNHPNFINPVNIIFIDDHENLPYNGNLCVIPILYQIQELVRLKNELSNVITGINKKLYDIKESGNLYEDYLIYRNEFPNYIQLILSSAHILFYLKTHFPKVKELFINLQEIISEKKNNINDDTNENKLIRRCYVAMEIEIINCIKPFENYETNNTISRAYIKLNKLFEYGNNLISLLNKRSAGITIINYSNKLLNDFDTVATYPVTSEIDNIFKFPLEKLDTIPKEMEIFNKLLDVNEFKKNKKLLYEKYMPIISINNIATFISNRFSENNKAKIGFLGKSPITEVQINIPIIDSGDEAGKYYDILDNANPNIRDGIIGENKFEDNKFKSEPTYPIVSELNDIHFNILKYIIVRFVLQNSYILLQDKISSSLDLSGWKDIPPPSESGWEDKFLMDLLTKIELGNIALIPPSPSAPPDDPVPFGGGGKINDNTNYEYNIFRNDIFNKLWEKSKHLLKNVQLKNTDDDTIFEYYKINDSNIKDPKNISDIIHFKAFKKAFINTFISYNKVNKVANYLNFCNIFIISFIKTCKAYNDYIEYFNKKQQLAQGPPYLNAAASAFVPGAAVAQQPPASANAADAVPLGPLGAAVAQQPPAHAALADAVPLGPLGAVAVPLVPAAAPLRPQPRVPSPAATVAQSIVTSPAATVPLVPATVPLVPTTVPQESQGVITLCYIKFNKSDNSTYFEKEDYYTRLENNNRNSFILTNGANQYMNGSGRGTTEAINKTNPNLFENITEIIYNPVADINYDEIINNPKQMLLIGKPAGTVYFKGDVTQTGRYKDKIKGVYHVKGVKINEYEKLDQPNIEQKIKPLVKKYYTAILTDFSSRTEEVIHLAQIPGELFGGTKITSIVMIEAVNEFIRDYTGNRSFQINIDAEAPRGALGQLIAAPGEVQQGVPYIFDLQQFMQQNEQFIQQFQGLPPLEPQQHQQPPLLEEIPEDILRIILQDPLYQLNLDDLYTEIGNIDNGQNMDRGIENSDLVYIHALNYIHHNHDAIKGVATKDATIDELFNDTLRFMLNNEYKKQDKQIDIDNYAQIYDYVVTAILQAYDDYHDTNQTGGVNIKDIEDKIRDKLKELQNNIKDITYGEQNDNDYGQILTIVGNIVDDILIYNIRAEIENFGNKHIKKVISNPKSSDKIKLLIEDQKLPFNIEEIEENIIDIFKANTEYISNTVDNAFEDKNIDSNIYKIYGTDIVKQTIDECYKFSEDVLNALINNGANLNIKDKDGNTPIFDAISAGNEEAIKILIDRSVVYNPKYKNRFGYNAYEYSLSSLEIMIDRFITNNAIDDITKDAIDEITKVNQTDIKLKYSDIIFKMLIYLINHQICLIGYGYPKEWSYDNQKQLNNIFVNNNDKYPIPILNINKEKLQNILEQHPVKEALNIKTTYINNIPNDIEEINKSIINLKLEKQHLDSINPKGNGENYRIYQIEQKIIELNTLIRQKNKIYNKTNNKINEGTNDLNKKIEKYSDKILTRLNNKTKKIDLIPIYNTIYYDIINGNEGNKNNYDTRTYPEIWKKYLKEYQPKNLNDKTQVITGLFHDISKYIKDSKNPNNIIGKLDLIDKFNKNVIIPFSRNYFELPDEYNLQSNYALKYILDIITHIIKHTICTNYYNIIQKMIKTYIMSVKPKGDNYDSDEKYYEVISKDLNELLQSIDFKIVKEIIDTTSRKSYKKDIKDIKLIEYILDIISEKSVKIVTKIYENENDPDKNLDLGTLLNSIGDIISTNTIIPITEKSRIINDLKEFINPYFKNYFEIYITKMKNITDNYFKLLITESKYVSITNIITKKAKKEFEVLN